jgi:hypothetical protein
MNFGYLQIFEVRVSAIRPKASAPSHQPDARCDERSHRLPLRLQDDMSASSRRTLADKQNANRRLCAALAQTLDSFSNRSSAQNRD